MQKAVLFSLCLMLPLSAAASASECRAPSPDRAASAVKITIRTPGGPAHGTGIIWDDRGHIVTNDHVASAGPSHEVTFANGETRTARVVARASDRDLAVLAVDPPREAGRMPAPAPHASARELRPGDPVFAIGNPFGRGLTLAQGVVNGFGREVVTGPVTHLYDMLETTTPLNPGNSGGPLFDCGGRVVGINTAVLQQAGGSLGFAIPIDRARTVVAGLLQERSTVAELAPPAAVPRPTAPSAARSGVTAPAAQEAAAPPRPGLGLFVAPDGAGGLLIQQVVPGSPAERAGARPGDAIKEANGRAVSSPSELQSVVQQAGNGTIAVLRIVRFGAPIDMAVQIRPVAFQARLTPPAPAS